MWFVVVCEGWSVVEGLTSLHLKEDEFCFRKVANGCAGAEMNVT
jgi:hypothetical protein